MLPQPHCRHIFLFVETKGKAMPFHPQLEEAARSACRGDSAAEDLNSISAASLVPGSRTPSPQPYPRDSSPGIAPKPFRKWGNVLRSCRT